MRLNIQINLRLNILISLLFFLPLLAFSVDDEDFSVYMARSRPSVELVETARSLVSNVRLSHLDDKIVIYGSKSSRAAALRLIKELDAPARTYRVHVRAAGQGSKERNAQAIEGQVGVGGVGVGKGRSAVLKREGGGSISIGGIKGTVESETVETANRGGQSITVIDGGTGMIYDSSLFANGVRVKLRSQGKGGAHLVLEQQSGSASGGQQLSTELDVKLGVWRNLGGLNQRNESANTEILGGSKKATASKQDIQVMVELDSSGD